MRNQALRVHGALALKRLIYGRRGEPYRLGAHSLRFVPGTRPFRLKWADLPPKVDEVARYDALQQLFLLKHLKSGMTAVDVGAHVGQDSLMMAALCGPQGGVTAFEPNAEARETFARNVALNPGLKAPELISAACSDQDGRRMLFNEPGHSANSSLTASGNGALGGYEVETVRLDTWAKAPPDLVKIDVEGFELRVLEGAERLLGGPTTFLVELHPYAWPALGDTYEKLRDLAASHGRRVRYIDQPEPPTEIPYTAQGYGIAVLERT